jgi:hypothetical protein
MLTPDQAAVREVPIHIFDFTEPPEGLLAGFYYNIPIPEDEKASPNEVALEGPFKTRSDALDAARDFVRDCLTDQATGDEE